MDSMSNISIRKSVKGAIDKQLNQLNHISLKLFNCKFCGKVFSEKSKFNRHSKTHTDGKRFECTQCEKKFAKKESLVIHERIHENKCPYKCNVCSKEFYDRSNLAKHKEVHKNDQERVVCDACGKSFRNKFSHKKHYENIHRKLKKGVEFNCSICQKPFKNVSDLKRHRLVHEEHKKFSCTLCNVQFRRKDNFDRHNKYFHRPVEKVTPAPAADPPDDDYHRISRLICNNACCLGKARLEIEHFQREFERQHYRLRTLTSSALLEIGAKNAQRLFENSPLAFLRNEFVHNSLIYDRIPVLRFGTKPYNEIESTEICKKIYETCSGCCPRLLPVITEPSEPVSRPPLVNAKSVIVSNVQRALTPVDSQSNIVEPEPNMPTMPTMPMNTVQPKYYDNNMEIEPQPIQQFDEGMIYHDQTDFGNSLITTYRDFD